MVSFAIMAIAGTLLLKTVAMQRGLDHQASVRLSLDLQVGSTATRLRQMDVVAAEAWAETFESDALSLRLESFETAGTSGKLAVVASKESPSVSRRVWWIKEGE